MLPLQLLDVHCRATNVAMKGMRQVLDVHLYYVLQRVGEFSWYLVMGMAPVNVGCLLSLELSFAVCQSSPLCCGSIFRSRACVRVRVRARLHVCVQARACMRVGDREHGRSSEYGAFFELLLASCV